MWKSYSTSVDQKVLASSHLPKDLKLIKPEKNCMAPLLRVEKLRYVEIHINMFVWTRDWVDKNRLVFLDWFKNPILLE